MLQRLFAGRQAHDAGRRLYLEAVSQARRPGFYREHGVADTADGRFELYSMHVILLLHRLKGQGQTASEAAQGLFDAYVKSLDDALREAGVGDLSVGKKMRGLGAAFLGRIKAYDAALARLPDRADLADVVARTVYGPGAPPDAGLADYVVAAVARLSAESTAALLRGEVLWPEPVR